MLSSSVQEEVVGPVVPPVIPFNGVGTRLGGTGNRGGSVICRGSRCPRVRLELSQIADGSGAVQLFWFHDAGLTSPARRHVFRHPNTRRSGRRPRMQDRAEADFPRIASFWTGNGCICTSVSSCHGRPGLCIRNRRASGGGAILGSPVGGTGSSLGHWELSGHGERRMQGRVRTRRERGRERGEVCSLHGRPDGRIYMPRSTLR
jgi:hypothetical protein